MKDTGHEFNAPQMELVGEWLRNDAAKIPGSQTSTNNFKP
jgi:hypothetical protein